ncbi:unnamed protein product [Heterobilharzia americana]|nr:unnamed protein product [Heterobilharzia americana]
MSFEYNSRGSTLQFLPNLCFDASVYDKFSSLSFALSGNRFWDLYKSSDNVCIKHGKINKNQERTRIVFPRKSASGRLKLPSKCNLAKTEVDDFEQRKVSNLIEPHGSSKRKHYGRSRELPQNNCMMTVEVSENSKKTKTVSKPQITSSEFRLDFLNIPTLLNGKKHFNQYLMQTTDEDSETYKSKRTTFKTNLLKFNINLKEKLNNQLFDETVMKAELKNALFQWATECGVEISKVPSRKIKYIFHCSNTLDIKVQLQAIVSIGIFETKLESEEIENLRGYLLHRNAEIVLSTCLCLTIMDYSDKKCIEKLCELLVLNQSPSKMNEENTRISFTLSYTSVNLLKWASSICLAKLNQCNLEILNNLTNPLFDQLIQFIPQQYPNKHFNKELNESSGSVGSLSHIIDRRTKSFVSNLSNLIAFDLKKANNFLTRIVCHSEIKMVLRLSRDHPQVEYYLTELLTSPNWRIRLCSCWLLSILLCNLCKNTLTRINRLLLLDWSSMLRIAALHSLHAEIKTMNPSLLWANQLFNDPFLLIIYNFLIVLTVTKRNLIKIRYGVFHVTS